MSNERQDLINQKDYADDVNVNTSFKFDSLKQFLSDLSTIDGDGALNIISNFQLGIIPLPTSKEISKASLLTMSELSDKHKIIGVDNYGRETVSDTLICDNCNFKMARTIANLLNAQMTLGNEVYFKVVPQSYELHKFNPND